VFKEKVVLVDLRIQEVEKFASGNNVIWERSIICAVVSII
jgi:hypothetical protein